MLSFESDYTEGAHEAILQKLIETNMEQLSGYGAAPYCERAKEKIRQACACDAADIFFLVGGTQTNATVIDCMLAPFEGVLSAATGHVSVHEAGAIEFGGHKVLELSQKDGKIQADTLRQYLVDYWADGNHEHMVCPGMVYISHPTEFGTLYTADELHIIADVCREYKLPLFLDGARLGYGLMAGNTDVTLAMIAECCDVFYIGGTKVGALCGEAVVFTKQNTPKHMITRIKQHGALLAKGRLLGIQFDTLFTDNLYMEISRHAIEMAELMKCILQEKGYRFYIESDTNQQFVIIENAALERLKEQVTVSFWEKYDESHTVIRLATSWATRQENVERLRDILEPAR